MDAPVALCVEDDPRMWALLADELPRHGLAPVHCPTVASAERALAMRPALTLIDLWLPDGDGLDVLRSLRRRWPGAPGVVLTVDDRPARVLTALREGACGYLLKDDIAARLPSVIDEVLRGALPLSPQAAEAVRSQLRGEICGDHALRVTAAEVEVLHGLALGLSYGQCALRTGTTINTVRSHVRAIYRKLDVTSKTEAVVAAVHLRLIALD